MTNATQVEKDIAYCIDYLDLDDNQIGEMLRVCEELGGISAEYFCEEFVFVCEDKDGNEDLEALSRVQDHDYLKIDWRLN